MKIDDDLFLFASLRRAADELTRRDANVEQLIQNVAVVADCVEQRIRKIADDPVTDVSRLRGTMARWWKSKTHDAAGSPRSL